MKYGMRKPSLKEIIQCQNEGKSNPRREKGVDPGLWQEGNGYSSSEKGNL